LLNALLNALNVCNDEDIGLHFDLLFLL